MLSTKRLFVFLCIFIMSFSLKAQEDDHMLTMDSLYKICIKLNTIQPLDDFFEKVNFINNDVILKKYLVLKTNYYLRILPVSLKGQTKNDIFLNSEFTELNESIKKYYELCQTCGTCALVEKYKLYHKLKIEDRFSDSEKEVIISAGYKPTKTGTGLQLRYIQSGVSFIGAEFFLKAEHEPSYSIKQKDPRSSINQIFCRQPYDFLATYGSLGVNYSPSNRNVQFLLSPLTLINPLYFKPLQTGIQFSSDKNILFYRPEVGFGFKGIHISGGYNVLFKKDARPYLNRWAYTIGYSYIFNQ